MRLAFTPGEPAGIGPDLAVMVAQQPAGRHLVAFADAQLLRQRAESLGLPLQILPASAPTPTTLGQLRVEPIPLAVPAVAGVLDPANSPYVLETIRRATQGCLQGDYQGLVTGPIHKGVINDAGVSFTGHTEYLAELCGTTRVVMMLTTPIPSAPQPQAELRVALVTTHLPLSQVPAAITHTAVVETIEIVAQTLKHHYHIPNPTITVCGLNPHAGEGGHMGNEELEVIIPALEQCRQQGYSLQGPLSADTAFTPKVIAHSDAIIAMYHDQGLATLKHLGFGRAVNLTLGLPIIRTSVDHGTALELAGSGNCNLDSLRHAIDTATLFCTGTTA